MYCAPEPWPKYRRMSDALRSEENCDSVGDVLISDVYRCAGRFEESIGSKSDCVEVRSPDGLMMEQALTVDLDIARVSPRPCCTRISERRSKIEPSEGILETG